MLLFLVHPKQRLLFELENAVMTKSNFVNSSIDAAVNSPPSISTKINFVFLYIYDVAISTATIVLRYLLL